MDTSQDNYKESKKPMLLTNSSENIVKEVDEEPLMVRKVTMNYSSST